MGVIYYAYPDPIFQPAMRLVTNITNSNPAIVTTSFDHDYITGTIVRMYVPRLFGMFEINHKIGTITVIDATTFSIDIDTTHLRPFISNIPLNKDYAQIPLVVPVGEVNETLLASTRNVLN